MSEVITLRPGIDYKVASEPRRRPTRRKMRVSAKQNSATYGRVDIALSRIAERLIPAPVYNSGVGDIVNELIRAYVPSKPVTPVDLARAAGILPARRRHARA